LPAMKAKAFKPFYRIDLEARTNVADLGVQNGPLSLDSSYGTARPILRTDAEETLEGTRNSFVKSVDQLLVEGNP
jgi:hypothetical protein